MTGKGVWNDRRRGLSKGMIWEWGFESS